MNRCCNLLKAKFIGYNHAEKPAEIKRVDLPIEQRIRLKNLLDYSMGVQRLDVSDIEENIGNTGIVSAILEVDEEYMLPESHLEPLVGYLFSVFGWTENDLPVVNPSKKLESIEGLLGALSLQIYR